MPSVVNCANSFLKSLHLCHNYYSLTAVIQGVKASGFMTEALSEFGELIDPSNNYQYYQHGMLKDGVLQGKALHFLLPALSIGASCYERFCIIPCET